GWLALGGAAHPVWDMVVHLLSRQADFAPRLRRGQSRTERRMRIYDVGNAQRADGEMERDNTREPSSRGSAFKLAGSALSSAAGPALMFVLAGDAYWPEGWLFAAWFIGLSATVIVWLYRNDPALLAERYRRPGSGHQSGWDRACVYLMVVGFAAWIVMMPL